MELAGILLVTCVLVLSTPSASAESGQLILRHAYPENNTNFSYIELTCLYESPELQSLAVGADFQLNGTDIEEELNVIDIGNATIRFILTPEKEGFFTCSLNGSLSNNPIGLAAQPSTNYSGQSRSHEVELPDADTVVSTELQCDIQPGALRQRYSIQWNIYIYYNFNYVFSFTYLVNQTLDVYSSSLNGSQYQCEVTIDHDGSIIKSYDGVLTTLVIALAPPHTPASGTNTTDGTSGTEVTAAMSDRVVVIVSSISAIIFGTTIIFLTIGLIVIVYKKKSVRENSVWINNEHPHQNDPECEMLLKVMNESLHKSATTTLESAKDQTAEESFSLQQANWMEPVATLTDCTSDGRSYYDEHNDFRLEIPEGAIPEGKRVTIDIGVALYGPFQYPKGLRPVSPVFWVCVRDQTNFRFSKLVTVTIPHCLNLENAEDVESLRMTFLKGDHEMTSQKVYQFQQAEGEVIIEPRKRNGVLRTTHFCYLCITSKKSKKSIRKAMFCISTAIPHTISPSEPAYVYFFVTFLLKTCLETVSRKISRFPELQEHNSQDFQFSKDTVDPALEIVLPTSHPAGWIVGLQFSKKILVSEIDFFVSGENMEELLKLKEERGMYPPRFCVVISCSPTARQSQARLEFSGATKELLFDVPLNPLHVSTHVASAADEIPTLSLPNFLNHVGVNIASRWQEFGILLDIPLSDLDTYPAHSCAACLSRVFDSWQRKGSPEFSWETVINVLESPLLNEMQLAKKVREMGTLHPKQDPSVS